MTDNGQLFNKSQNFYWNPNQKNFNISDGNFSYENISYPSVTYDVTYTDKNAIFVAQIFTAISWVSVFLTKSLKYLQCVSKCELRFLNDLCLGGHFI